MSLSTLRELAKDIIESERLIKQAEIDKDEMIHLMQQMLDHSPKVIFWKDTTGKILGCNKACEQLFDMPSKDLIGKSINDLFGGHYAEIFKSADNIASINGKYEYDIAFKMSSGKDIEARVSVWKSHNLAGDNTGVIIFAYSMTPTGAI